jgi:hypothetical protein
VGINRASVKLAAIAPKIEGIDVKFTLPPEALHGGLCDWSEKNLLASEAIAPIALQAEPA